MGMTMRSASSRIRVMIFGICCLLLYHILLSPQSPPQVDPPKAASIGDVMREIDHVENKKIFHDIEYKSPFHSGFFNDKEGNAPGPGDLDLTLKAGQRSLQAASEDEVERVRKYNKIWTWADEIVTRDEMFPDSPMVDEVLQALAKARIVHVDKLGDRDVYEDGTAEKWIVTLEGGQKANMKIEWEPDRKGIMKAGGLCNLGYELPWSEIAAFHLHRIFGFRNTPYVSGRKIDLVKEILPVATPHVRRQIQQMQNGSICVVGKCYFCKEPTTFCPPGGIVQASLAYWMPRKLKLYTYPVGYMPWATPRMEVWGQAHFNNKTYCKQVQKEIHPYKYDWYYYDLFDFAVIDTLMFHYDSKHYVVYDDSPARGLTIRLDHGRAFCRHDEDEDSVFLAPIIQCCTLRKSTMEKLKKVKNGNILSRRWKKSLEVDPLHPVLHDVWYKTIERRLAIIFDMLDKCAKANGGYKNILVDG